MDKLLSLLALVRQAQEAETLLSFGHVLVNETRRLIPYKQAIFWTQGPLGPTLQKISGNIVVDDNGPMAAQIKSFIALHTKGAQDDTITLPCGVFTPLGYQVTLILFKTRGHEILGGLWIETDGPLKDAAQTLLAEYARSCAPLLALYIQQGARGFLAASLRLLKYKRLILAGITLLCLFPTRHSITAPAEIIPLNAALVTSPMDGLIRDVLVKPGDSVTAGHILVKIDDTALTAEQTQAEQELMVAESALARVSREALHTPEKKADISLLQADITEKTIRRDYAAALRSRTDITSPKDGTAIFADATDLRGKPVRIGDAVMKIADPAQKELLIRVPVGAMMPIQQNADVSFHVSPMPLSGGTARITGIGYEATPDANGTLTYKIHAQIDSEDNVDDSASLRVGWQGMATIHGEWTILSYALLRSPLATLRSIMGI